MIKPEFLLFVDFDGVTHPVGVDRDNMFNENCLRFINQAAGVLEASLVITSTHRLIQEPSEFSKYFQSSVIGITPSLSGPLRGQRQREIEAFISSNGYSNSHWIAIDDQPTLFNNTKQLICTNPALGFTLKDMNETILLFTKLCPSLTDRENSYDY